MDGAQNSRVFLRLMQQRHENSFSFTWDFFGKTPPFHIQRIPSQLQERYSFIMSSRRRRHIEEPEDESEDDGPIEEEEDNDSNAVDVKQDPEFSGEDDPVGKYRPGSIRRIKLKNFLTYERVEFSPGPR